MKLTKFRFVLVGLILFLIVILLSFSDLFTQIEAKLDDLFMQQRGYLALTEKVSIVAIDEETMRMLDVQWPLPRSLYVEAVENMIKAGAEVVVFDIQFPETAQISLPGAENKQLVEEINSRLARYDIELGLIAHSFNVIHACKIEKEGDSRFLLLPNNSIMQAQPKLGLVSNFTDKDNSLRKYQVMDSLNNREYYSLALKALSLYTKSEITVNPEKQIITCGKQTVPYFLNHLSPINYRAPAGAFVGDKSVNAASTYFSFIDLINLNLALSSDELDFFSELEIDEELSFRLEELGIEQEAKTNLEKLIEKQVFKDRIVFIGSTLKEHHDNFNTPFGIMPGVEIHANYLDSLLADDLLNYMNHFLFILIFFIIILLFSYIFSKYNAYISLGLLALALSLQYIITLGALKQYNLIIPKVEITLSLLLIYSYNLVVKYLEEAKGKREIKRAFQHYMAPELVEKLIADPKQLQYGGASKEISVLFSDIRSFTTYTESHPIEDTVAMLKEYLTEMTKIVLANKGIIDKYIGDSIMALFGTPIQDDNHAYNACKTALLMRAKLTELQAKWETEGKDLIEIGIGINSGVAVVGNLGSEQLFDYTAIGDSINLGARLEGLNKKYASKNKIIISQFTLAYLQDRADVTHICEEMVKGKNLGVDVYHLNDLR